MAPRKKSIDTSEDEASGQKTSRTRILARLPVVPLKDVVVYPHMVVPLFVGRERSVKGIEAAMEADQKVILVAQQDPEEDTPALDTLYRVGTISTVLQLLRLPDGTLKVLIEGESRVKIARYDDESAEYVQAEYSYMKVRKVSEEESEAIQRTLIAQFEQYVKLNKKIPPEVMSALAGIEDLDRLVDTIAAHMTLRVAERQELLEELNLQNRLEMLMQYMEAEIDVLQLEKRIRGRVKQQMEKNQKEYYLNEQMKAIQRELGELSETGSEVDQLEQKIQDAKMPKDVMDKALAELKKLKGMPAMSPEANVSRNYLDVLLGVPWFKKSKVKKNLNDAEKILNQDHFGLEKVKERILEYLAVQSRVNKIKGPILCLVGPPGVGKTSVGASIARATGREFARIALGGVRDEAEIRGHRRTYVGALPGKIIQKISKAGVKNPLILLDEIDKISSDFRGDPSSALLEVLDPEQNKAFNDHYLEVDYDLSDVMFVATANTLDIPAPLLDRMEVIRLSGYTDDEKLNIAKQYLIPKHLEQAGLKPDEAEITDDALVKILQHYTREAGVRALEREIAKICRKVVREIVSGNGLKSEVASKTDTDLKADTSSKKRKIKQETSRDVVQSATMVRVDASRIENYLGVPRYKYDVAELEDCIGQVNGLAWTEVGGEMLKIEAAVMPGKGTVIRTGKLGEVMLESIQAAVTLVRTFSPYLNLPEDYFEKHDLHIHAPEGATPKDGPSAGIAITTAIMSVVTGIPVLATVAMTGEVTLAGHVLPIGGLKEKLLAALRGNIKRVLIPEENEKDLAEIPENVKAGLEIIPVSRIRQVFEYALQRDPLKKHG